MRYCIIKGAVTDALLLTSIGSKKFSLLLADRNWHTSCVKDVKASFQAIQRIFRPPADSSPRDFNSQPKCPQRKSKQVAGRENIFFYKLRYGRGRPAGSSAMRPEEVRDGAAYWAEAHRVLPADMPASHRYKIVVYAPNWRKGSRHLKGLSFTDVAQQLQARFVSRGK